MRKIRKDTVDRQKRHTLIDITKQNLIGILGIRGSGKSYLAEALLERYFDVGYTCLDLWAAPNLENAFWIFAKEGHKKRIPIIILAPESFIIPEPRVDRFNGNYITKQPLIEFVKLPIPTKKTDSEQNDKILEILTETILNCRSSRRILVFNPYMFPNETEMFRTLEILMRNLISISEKHFHAIDPKKNGYEKRTDMPNSMQVHHKMCFLIREFGEVAPARLKGDKSGESTLIKKALLKFVRLARHANIDGIIDYQNASDADASIRNQIGMWLIKKWTEQLGGVHFKHVFQYLDAKRTFILKKFGYNNNAFKKADSIYPPIEKLSQGWFYVHEEGYPLRLKKVPELHIRHKEPYDKWTTLTGIPLEYDKKLLQKPGVTGGSKTTSDERKILYGVMCQLKFPIKGKGLKWTGVIEKIKEKIEQGELTSSMNWKTMTERKASAVFSALKKKFGELGPESIVLKS